MTSARSMPLGPLMLDIAGPELAPEDCERLQHPLTGGVILFSRNYQTPSQLFELTSVIHALRDPKLLIAVDHEGGRVQRFREGFTRIPPMRELGKIWDVHPYQAKSLARMTGFVLAAELRACGVDLSFTPVLDVDHGASTIIGDRAFHSDPQAIAVLGNELMLGLKQSGMGAVGKHFPGHGYIAADSHLEVPVDERSFEDIEMLDLVPFTRLISLGLTAVMPAHVIYPKVDVQPAGFSRIWLKDVLRQKLGFEGTVFSDDLSMEGARTAGGILERAQAALHAGCDMVLACNDRVAADKLQSGLRWSLPAVSLARLAQLHGRPHPASLARLRKDSFYTKALHKVAGIGIASGNLVLNRNTDGRA